MNLTTCYGDTRNRIYDERFPYFADKLMQIILIQIITVYCHSKSCFKVDNTWKTETIIKAGKCPALTRK